MFVSVGHGHMFIPNTMFNHFHSLSEALTMTNSHIVELGLEHLCVADFVLEYGMYRCRGLLERYFMWQFDVKRKKRALLTSDKHCVYLGNASVIENNFELDFIIKVQASEWTTNMAGVSVFERISKCAIQLAKYCHLLPWEQPCHEKY